MVLNALGVAYANGLGAEQDTGLGLNYFRKAVELGSESAKKNLERLQGIR